MAQKIFGITIGKKDDLDLTVSSKKKFSIPFLGKKDKVEEEIDIADLEIDFVPTLPAVNVIPPSVTEKYNDKDITKKFIRAGIAIVAVIILIFGYTNIGELNHQANIATLEAEGDALRGKIAELQPYETYKTEVEAKIVTISGIMTKDVDVQRIVDFVFSTAAANSIKLESLDIKIIGDGGGDCLVTNPFEASAALGCVTVSGNQPNAESVNTFFSTIASTPGYIDDFINSTQYSDDPESNSFAGSFAFTAELYSNKYNNMLLPIDTLLENGIEFEAPEAAVDEAETSTNNGTTPNTQNNNSTVTPSPTPTPSNSTNGSTNVGPNGEELGPADDPNFTPEPYTPPAPITGGS